MEPTLFGWVLIIALLLAPALVAFRLGRKHVFWILGLNLLSIGGVSSLDTPLLMLIPGAAWVIALGWAIVGPKGDWPWADP